MENIEPGIVVGIVVGTGKLMEQPGTVGCSFAGKLGRIE